MNLKNTTELSQGDVVMHFGMRILIDGPASVLGREHGYCDDTPVYKWPGTVINADEIRATEGTGYMRRFLCEDPSACGCGATKKDSWSVQGNRLATWTVEDR